MRKLLFLTLIAPGLIAVAIMQLFLLPAVSSWYYPGIALAPFMAFVLAVANAVLAVCGVQWLARRWSV